MHANLVASTAFEVEKLKYTQFHGNYFSLSTDF